MIENFNMSALDSLAGKVVRVYKAGPESTIGRLVAVNSDHIVVDSEQDGIVYFNASHIKSVCEDLNLNDNYSVSEKPEDYYQRFTEAVDLNDVLQRMKYGLIKIDRNGPEARIGRLIGVEDDYFTVNTVEDGIVHYQTHHVKSLSLVTSHDANNSNSNNNNNNNNKNNKNNKNGKNNNSNSNNNNVNLLDTYPSYIGGASISELCQNLENYWVKINRNGPESVEGVLSGWYDDHMVLVNNKEVYHIAMFHMRNLSYQNKNVINLSDTGGSYKKKKKSGSTRSSSKSSKNF